MARQRAAYKIANFNAGFFALLSLPALLEVDLILPCTVFSIINAFVAAHYYRPKRLRDIFAETFRTRG